MKRRRRAAKGRRALQSKLLLYLRAVGALAENAELAVQFQVPPSNASHEALLTMARGMLEKATLHKDVLVKRGMSEQLLGDLAGALGEFEQTIEATRAGRREHPSLRSGQAPSLRSGQVVGASADLKAVAAEIKEVRVLDGLVRFRFGDDAERMGAWASARNVLGPFKPKAEPGAGGSQTPKAA